MDVVIASAENLPIRQPAGEHTTLAVINFIHGADGTSGKVRHRSFYLLSPVAVRFRADVWANTITEYTEQIEKMADLYIKVDDLDGARHALQVAGIQYEIVDAVSREEFEALYKHYRQMCAMIDEFMDREDDMK